METYFKRQKKQCHDMYFRNIINGTYSRRLSGKVILFILMLVYFNLENLLRDVELTINVLNRFDFYAIHLNLFLWKNYYTENLTPSSSFSV